MANDLPQDTLYYDGQCPVCRSEISKLERGINDNALVCIDIHSKGVESGDRERLMSQLHLRTSDGKWLVGLEANVTAWRHTKWKPLASMLMWPGVRLVAEAAYKGWLIWYQRQRARRLASVD